MVNQSTLNNITYSVVGGILSGMVVAVSFGQTLKLPTWGVSLLGIFVVLLVFGLAKLLEGIPNIEKTTPIIQTKKHKKTDWNMVNAISNITLSALTFFAVLAVIGFFNSADIHPTRQINSHSECPYSIDRAFNIQFINLGNKATQLCVNVYSKEINFSRNVDCLFMAQSTTANFEYSFPNFFGHVEQFKNFTIIYNIKYKKNIFKSVDEPYACRYVSLPFTSYLKLIE